MDQAAREVRATYEIRCGERHHRFQHLCEFIDERVVRCALQWLGLDAGVNQPVHSPTQRASQATQLVALAAAAELFHTPDDEAYAL